MKPSEWVMDAAAEILHAVSHWDKDKTLDTRFRCFLKFGDHSIQYEYDQAVRFPENDKDGNVIVICKIEAKDPGKDWMLIKKSETFLGPEVYKDSDRYNGAINSFIKKIKLEMMISGVLNDYRYRQSAEKKEMN